MKQAIRATLLLAMCLWPGWLAHAQGDRTFKARLSSVPAPAALGGSGSVSAVLTGPKLSIAGSFEGLPSPATVARLHSGAKGIRGPAVFDLKVSGATSGTISGVIELSPQQLQNLEKSRFYVQLHSGKAPNGHLWGWLLPQ